MFIRLVLSVASLTVALAGGVVIDCTSPVVAVLEGDPTGLCVAAEPLGTHRGLWAGAGLVLLAAIALATIWVPTARRYRHRQRGPVMSLQDNLGRLVESAIEEPVEPPSRNVLHVVRLTRKLEAIETALAADTVATREVTEQWMRLLREANELHNTDELPAEDFKQINTRLLDLFSPPVVRDQRDPELTGTSPEPR